MFKRTSSLGDVLSTFFFFEWDGMRHWQSLNEKSSKKSLEKTFSLIYLHFQFLSAMLFQWHISFLFFSFANWFIGCQWERVVKKGIEREPEKQIDKNQTRVISASRRSLEALGGENEWNINLMSKRAHWEAREESYHDAVVKKSSLSQAEGGTKIEFNLIGPANC